MKKYLAIMTGIIILTLTACTTPQDTATPVGGNRIG
jgi:hypothetical protein